MEGHPARGRFLALLAFATCMAFALSCAANLLLMAVAWVLLSASVHQLLVFGGDTRAAWRAARRKFLVARLGEVALFGAIGLLWWRCGSLDIGACLRVVPQLSHEALTPIALLLALAAMARSVQVPFHAWLPDTMEAPTPVSALLHAGIVNAGGILLIRFAPLMVRVPEACLLLSVVGTATVVVGALAMQQQLRVKQSLAWSTVAQMGFMVVQCAVAAFPAALLHLIGHGAYKAMAFLRSGETPKRARALGPAWWNMALLVCGTIAAIACMAPAARWTGFDPRHAPGEMALALVVAIGVGQTWIAALGACGRAAGDIIRGVGIAAVSALAAPVLCFAAYRAAGIFLQPVIGELPQATGPLMAIAAAR
jgi:NAD(P)H-quinone oxidoreductase subunit 5